MKNAVTVLKMTAARWPSSAICGGLPFPQAGPFSYSGNHLESGGIRVNMLTRRFALLLYRTNG